MSFIIGESLSQFLTGIRRNRHTKDKRYSDELVVNPLVPKVFAICSGQLI